MKKKNGTSAGIPRPSGERSSPVGNAPREVRPRWIPFYFRFLFFPFFFCPWLFPHDRGRTGAELVQVHLPRYMVG